MEELVKWSAGVAADQLPFVTALTLTRTMQDAKVAVEREMPAQLDRPTPYTQRGFRIRPARKDKLSASIDFREDARTFLSPQVYGGQRKLKALERALQAAGHLPAGWLAVPGQGAKLDSFGNVERGQILQVLSQLRITMTAGATRNMSFDARRAIRAQQRAGGRFFVVKPGASKSAPGVYQREFAGRNVTPVFIFVRGTYYKVRLPLEKIVETIVRDRLSPNFRAAWIRARETAAGYVPRPGALR